MKTLVIFIFSFFGMGNFNISVKNLRNELNVNKVFKYLFTFLFVLLVSISNATNYYVSASGNDTNSGTSESQPWKSLSKVSSFYFRPGDQILFKRGDSWSGTITVTSSGASGSPIVYGAYGTGEKPKIYGSEEITGWTKHTGNIYKATFGKTVTQLFINGERLKVARYPNNGYVNVSAVKSSTQFTCNDLDAGINYSGASWTGRTREWTITTRKVTTSSTNTLTLSSAPYSGLGVDEGFFLTNKLEFLDEAGEWYYDTSSNTVYLWTPSGNSPANYITRGSTNETGVSISSKNYITIENLEIAQHQSYGIYASGCNYLTVDDNAILYPESFSIYTSNDKNGTYSNNIIKGSNERGIWASTESSSIIDNAISNIAVFDQLGIKGAGAGSSNGTAISALGNNNTFEYNQIQNVAYCGISWTGINAMIKYNYIRDVCMIIADGGAIYTYVGADSSKPGSAGSEVTSNIIINANGTTEGYPTTFEGGYGIYMDDGTHDVKVRYNTVHGSTTGIFSHINSNNYFEYNQISDCLIGMLTKGENGASYWHYNTIYAYNRKGNHIWWQNSQQRMVKNESLSKFDYNKYINHYESDNIFSNSYNFSEWKAASKQGANSTLDITSLGTGETEEFFYNNTKQNRSINLGNSVYRDFDGNKVTGTITLKPFTSQILIKTISTDSGSNQTPVIQNQMFGILGDQNVNDFIGQVVASDPDSDQKLTYAIEQVNTEGLFYIDETTGAIYANSAINEVNDKSIDLIVTVTDNAVIPLTASAIITISITGVVIEAPVDIIPPTISSFTVPSVTTLLNIPITSFSAEDNIQVVGYLITTSPEVPSVDAVGWSPTAPTSFNFNQNGTFTIYAWVKDPNGNISTPISKIVTVSKTEVTSTYSEYMFEEGSGTEVIDARGSNHGVIVNEEIRGEGVKGDGIQFNGTGYIQLGQCFGEIVTNGVTLSAWIKPNGTTGDYQGIIMHGGPDYDSFALYIKPSSNTIGFKTSATTSEWTRIDNLSLLWDGDWHHVVATYNGSEKVIYIDNQIITNVSANGNIVSGAGYNMYIGAGRDQASPIALYTGNIDEVSVYNYGLTSLEVEDLYNSVKNYSGTVYTTEDIFICDGGSYKGYTSPGEYQRVLQTVSGGDSIVTTNLFVNPVYSTTESINIKIGENYLGWTTTGKYTRTLETVSGCDSIVTTILEVQQTPAFDTVYTTENVSICEGSSYQSWTSAGEYQRVLQTSAGGDSIVTTYLHVNPVYTITENIQIQAGENYLGWTTSGQYTRTLETVSGCDSIVTTILEVQQTSVSAHFQTVWDGENGQNHMTICIADALIEGVKLEKGDEIAIFDNDQCVGSIVLSASIDINDEGTYAFITVSQAIGDLNGFTEGHKIIYRVWDSSEQVEKNINQVTYNNDLSEWITSGNFVAGGTSLVEIGYVYVEPTIVQSINLDKGWNIFSSTVVPEDAEMSAVHEELTNNDVLFKVQDESGNSYEKIKKDWINNIGNLEESEGYKIRVKSSCTLQITGKQVRLPMNINVKAGSNLISFPYNGSVNAMQVIQPLIDAGILEKVQDEKGNSIEYWGTTIGWLNGIGNFNSGEGYLVQVTENGVLPISDIYEKSVLLNSESRETVYFRPGFEGNGSNHMNINLFGLNQTDLKVGDEIAAYDGDICVGATKLTSKDLSKNAASIIASASDADKVNGFIENNDIVLKYWSDASTSEIDLSILVLDGNLIFNKYASMFAMLNKQMPGIDDNGLNSLEIDMYPNPAINNVTISFSDLPEIRSKIILMDMNGKQLQSREVQSTREVFDLQSYPTGVYLMKTIVGDVIKVNKLIKN